MKSGSIAVRLLVSNPTYAAQYKCLFSQLPGLCLVEENAEVLFGEPSLIESAMSPSVRWIQLSWAGAEKAVGIMPPGVRLTNVRIFGPLMSEYCFAYLLAHERRLVERNENVRAGVWDTQSTGTLRGKTIGICGVGAIGAHLASTAKHFGMAEVRGLTRQSTGCADVDHYFHDAKDPDFTTGLDYLIVCTPETQHTKHLVDDAMLRQLKPESVLVNVGRSSAIDEVALCEALKGGRLARAVLDVCSSEPLPAEHWFWSEPRVTLTCHTAAVSSPDTVAPVFVSNFAKYLQNRSGPLDCEVDLTQGY